MLFNKLRASKAWKELDNNADKKNKEDDDRRKRDVTTLNSL